MDWRQLKKTQLRRKLEKRASIIKLIRRFFDERGFLEIDSPLLVRFGNLEPNLNLLKTEIREANGKKHQAYLITSPEYSLKKILSAGFSEIYQLGKCFRNGEPWNETHNPEFTLLEWYEAGKNYSDLMERAEELMEFLMKNLFAGETSQELKYQNRTINLTRPWARLSMREAWQKYAKADLNEFLTYDTMRSLAKNKGYTIGKDDTFDDLFFKIFLSEIEPRLVELGRPVFLFDYPVSLAALAQIKKDDPRFAERFELYLGGLELANAYTELTDAAEQEKRFKNDQAKMMNLSKEVLEIDQDFISALKSGLPQCAGIALGVDRLIMLLTDSKDISEIMPFTTKEIF